MDNCILVFNKDQKDEDHNGIGDICEDNPYSAAPEDQTHKIEIVDEIPAPATEKKQANIDIFDIEKYPWIPLVGIAFAVIIIIILFTVTALSDSSEVSTDRFSINNNKAILLTTLIFISSLIVLGVFFKIINGSTGNFKWFKEGAYFEYDFRSSTTNLNYPNIMSISLNNDSSSILRTHINFNGNTRRSIDEFGYLGRIDNRRLTRKKDGLYYVKSDCGFGIISKRIYEMKLPKTPNIGDSIPYYVCEEIKWQSTITEVNKKIVVPAGEFEVYVIDNGNHIEYWNNKYGLIKFEVFNDTGESVGTYSLADFDIDR